jgi:hypothetical protein
VYFSLVDKSNRSVTDQLVRTAQRLLASHDAAGALGVLKLALSECTSDARQDMTKILHYIGLSLYKTGFKDCAAKTWCSGRKFSKRGLLRDFAGRFTNEYGMLRQKHPYLDDWKAFYSVHIKRYFEQKRNGNFSSPPERDTVRQLIMDQWYEMGDYSSFQYLEPDQKLALFRSVRIVFPLNHAPEHIGDRIIPFFSPSNSQIHEKTCFCGSGLYFHQCCGRTDSEEEMNLR